MKHFFRILPLGCVLLFLLFSPITMAETPAQKEAIVIVLMGPPGAGKGTQARFVAKRLGIPHISTGDLIRHHQRENTPLGIKSVDYTRRGLLLPDAWMLEMLAERARESDALHGYLLDGFPRTMGQAKALGNHLGKARFLVINLRVSDDVVLQRLTGRQREDDTHEVVNERLKVFHEQTKPLIDYYQNQGVLIDIDGSGSIDAVKSEIFEALEKQGVL